MMFVALVTGANKGIGLEICRRLCLYIDTVLKDQGILGKVLMGSRDVSRGRAAVKSLQEEFPRIPELLILDVSSEESVKKASREIAKQQYKLSALILNAGVAYLHSCEDRKYEEYKETFEVNYFGVRRCFTNFLPLMRETGRIVVVCSSLGRLAWEVTAIHHQNRMKDLRLTPKGLDAIAKEILE
eukprot:Gregarina_sp_Pseudo_9__1430@NODE_1958_length_1233_cov_28_134003_g1815_i0_p1_GENE_NODE_1958_length_1233_cov_28_134003_g1815_i0NODE_1958_length_1233_cov_28_134003_g1815_i0_p1_ORF_typecomplete_len185_score43_45adh_short/PF00106_25/3_3e31adh_short_C2/PF13561_6/4_5e19KR/PF08659_10/5_7e09Epimerase/PF01370_21/0_019Hema_stalk/PF08720_10/0_074ANT/PF03374_14/1_3_NODE_1958_length_1233_cov_28_134003_g1815_i05891143